MEIQRKLLQKLTAVFPSEFYYKGIRLPIVLTLICDTHTGSPLLRCQTEDVRDHRVIGDVLA